MPPVAGDSRRSWRGAQRGVLVRRSRNVWRWLLSVTALCLVGLAIYWAWPRPIPRTLLLILSAEREDRTLPLVPYVAGDRRALLDWASAANVPTSDLTLADLGDASAIRARLAPGDQAGDRIIFERRGKSTGKFRLSKNDRLILYVKAHGVALDAGASGQSDVQPLLIKRLSEEDLAGPWQQSDAHVLRVGPLLEELARLPDVETLVVFDVVHVNYDPRLGIVFNAFPEAIRRVMEKLPQSGNLAVLVCQGNGELSAGVPAAGRSAVVEGFVKVLEREPKGAAAISLEQFVGRFGQRLAQFGGSGRSSFRQSVQLLGTPVSSGRMASFVLPLAAPAESDPAKAEAGKEKEKSDASKAIVQSAERQAAAAVPAPVTAAATSAQQVSQAITGAIPSSGTAIAPGGTAEKSTAADNRPMAPADTAPVNNGPPAVAGATTSTTTTSTASAAADAPPPAAPKTDIELAWQARDRLRSNYKSTWTPVHVSPQQWRRIEAVLAGFDEELLPPGQEPRDPQTLATLSRDLETLAGYFAGGRDLPNREDCSQIASSLNRFDAGVATRTFQSRQAGALDDANLAVRIFSEGLYRAADYVRLHGRTIALLDGGPLLNDGLLDQLLTRLGALRGLLSPVGLAEGRLTEVRLSELARTAREVEQSLERLDREIADYAKATAAAAPSAGQMLRARLLLGSPLLAADLRPGLREQKVVSGPLATEPISSAAISFGDRLATNARLSSKLLEIAVPLDATGEATLAAGNVILPAIDSQASPLQWAILGRRLCELSQQWPGMIRTRFEERIAGKSMPPGSDLFDLYRIALVVDGRDARRIRVEAGDVTIAQPILPPRIPDRIAVKFSPERVQLSSPNSDGTLVELALEITSEQPPPYTISLELDWNDREIAVARAGEGPPLRKGANSVSLTSEKLVLPLRVTPRRVSRENVNVNLTANGRFAASPVTSGRAVCQLPRPDEVEMTLAADSNLAAARRRSWLPSGQQGGRLRLFAGREKAFSIYLTNQSSEEKRLFARLYRVPRVAVDSSGRLFDPRSPAQLLAATAGYDARLGQPNANPTQILLAPPIAQSNEKEPLVLPADQAPQRVVLLPIAPPAPAAAASSPPGEEMADITNGLVLVLMSVDGKSRPHAKWIELQTHQPDDLLEIRDPLYEQGRLTFRVALKDAFLVEEMGLAKQPLALAWDTLPLPGDVQVPAKEALITAEGDGAATFSASVAPSASWPVFIHLSADGYPRGLLSGLSWRGGSSRLENYKIDHPPVVHLTRVAAAAQRPGTPPEKLQFLYPPERPWLPYPSPAAMAEGLPLSVKGRPIMVRVDERSPTVRVDCDLGADIAMRHFSEGGRLRVSLAGQNKLLSLDRQATARFAGVEEGAIKLASQVADFRGLDFDPIDVPQDRRVELVAEVTGEATTSAAGGFESDKLTLILDRTPPTVHQLVAQKRLAPPPPMPDAPPPTLIALQCQADDGQGSGIAAVEFVVGFDRNQNDRLDADERRPAVLGRHYGQGIYTAEYSLADLPGEYLLVEAVARDNVQQASAPGYFSLRLPKPTPGGGQRTTFGGKKVEPEPPNLKKDR